MGGFSALLAHFGRRAPAVDPEVATSAFYEEIIPAIIRAASA